MITRSSIAFGDFLGSSIAPQVMPPLGLMNRPSRSGQVIKVGWSKCPLPAVVILIISIAEIVKTQDGWGEWSGQDDQ